MCVCIHLDLTGGPPQSNHTNSKLVNFYDRKQSQKAQPSGSPRRGWFEPWPRTSWQGAKEPELAILKYEIILSFQSIWLILGKYDHLWFWVTGIWAPTFLVKVVTHKLYFSGVTAFSSFSADLRSRLKPPSDSMGHIHFPILPSVRYNHQTYNLSLFSSI